MCIYICIYIYTHVHTCVFAPAACYSPVAEQVVRPISLLLLLIMIIMTSIISINIIIIIIIIIIIMNMISNDLLLLLITHNLPKTHEPTHILIKTSIIDHKYENGLAGSVARPISVLTLWISEGWTRA